MKILVNYLTHNGCEISELTLKSSLSTVRRSLRSFRVDAVVEGFRT